MSPQEIATQASRLARARNDSHGGFIGVTAYPDNRVRAHEIGAIGELWFSRWSGLPMPKLRTSGGDEGYDFLARLPDCRLRIDVKTRCHPTQLLVGVAEIERRLASIYVLVHCDARDAAHGIGWAHRCTVAAAPIGHFALGPAHALARHDLRPMAELRRLIDMRIAP